MRSRAILSVLCSALLAACSPHLAALSFTPGAGSKPAAPADQAAPTVICTASMAAAVPARPPLPATAGFPAPQTPAAAASVGIYLTWLHSLSVLTDSLIQRATDTRSFCLAHQPKQDPQK